MTIDPNSFNPDEIKKLILEGVKIGPDGTFHATRIETNPDPKIAKQELNNLAAFAKTQRATELSPEAKALALKEQAELRSMLDDNNCPEEPKSLRAAFDDYLAIFKKGIATTTKKSYTESFDLFCRMMGGDHRLVHEIKRADCKEFNKALSFVPLHASKRGIEIKTYQEMLRKPPVGTDSEGKSYKLDVLAARSCNDHLTNMSGFYDWAIEQGHYVGENPLNKLPRHSDGEDQGGAEAFTEEELKKIFASETFMAVKRPHEYWGPLFALFTGARANEIACLDLVDFISEGGVRCISIKHRPRKKPASITHEKSSKRTKNASSRRIVPLHPRLWDLGLEDYLQDLKAIGATRLFPHLPMDSRDKRDRYLSRDINNYLMRIGVHEPRTKVLHSFRDTVSDALGESNLDAVRADQWTGHAPVGVKARSYRSRSKASKQAGDAFESLNFSFLPFDDLRYKPGWWNEWLAKNMVP